MFWHKPIEKELSESRKIGSMHRLYRIHLTLRKFILAIQMVKCAHLTITARLTVLYMMMFQLMILKHHQSGQLLGVTTKK